MQPLRAARSLTRLVLVWFALALGVAIASPLVKPSALQLVCTGTGMQLLVASGGGDADDGEAPARHTLDCPLCAAVAPPPPVVAVPLAQPLGHVPQPIPAARHAALVAPPLPARGPPALS
jgi:hypothetical protein